MIEMTLSSRHRIRNSSPGGLRPSTLPLGHGGSPQYWLSHVDGEKHFLFSFKPPRPGTEPRTVAWKAAVLTTTLGPRAILFNFAVSWNCVSLPRSTPASEWNYPANTRHWTNVGSMLACRLRRQPNIEPTLVLCLVLADNLICKM